MTKPIQAEFNMNITKEMSINDCLKMYPQTKMVFTKYKMGCLGCMGASAESIEKGAMMHGLEINKLLDELNKLSKDWDKRSDDIGQSR